MTRSTLTIEVRSLFNNEHYSVAQFYDLKTAPQRRNLRRKIKSIIGNDNFEIIYDIYANILVLMFDETEDAVLFTLAKPDSMLELTDITI